MRSIAFGLATLAAGQTVLDTAAPPAPPSPPPIAPSPQPTTPPVTSKSVDVYILMGQSNCVGMGLKTGWKDGTLEYAVGEKKMYPYLLNKDGSWAVRSDVRSVFTMVSGNKSFTPKALQDNTWMTAGKPSRSRLGLELGIGNFMANFTKNPTMILKSCIGNRALGWDLLPPGSPSWEYGGYTYAGYHGSPEKCKTGTTCPQIGWMAGEQYDGDVAAAKAVLGKFSTYYPGATKYEVKGLFWWQGDRDRYDMGLASRYETNLVALIKSIRKDYNAPNAPFVTATLGQTAMGAGGAEGAILDAMFAISDSKKHPEFKGTTATVYTHPYARGGGSSSHYGLNAEVYMDVGEHMADAMIGLLKGASEEVGPPAPPSPPSGCMQQCSGHTSCDCKCFCSCRHGYDSGCGSPYYVSCYDGCRVSRDPIHDGGYYSCKYNCPSSLSNLTVV